MRGAHHELMIECKLFCMVLNRAKRVFFFRIPNQKFLAQSPFIFNNNPSHDRPRFRFHSAEHRS
jgi:hypothetical protein